MQKKVDQLVEFLNADSLSKGSLREFLVNLELTRDDLFEWSDFDHPEQDSYGRKTICLGEHFELMVMSWVPGDFSMIHNHGDASWGLVQSFGSLTHRVYSHRNEVLTLEKEEELSEGQLVPVTHELIHQMGNATEGPIVSLHYYFNETPTQFITDNTFLFDVVNGEIQTVRGGAFYALPEDEIIEKNEGLNCNDALLNQEETLLQERMAVIS